MPDVNAWCVYLLLCHKGTIYVGISNDVEKRYLKHAAGQGSTYTRINRPVATLAKVDFPSKSAAAKAERAVKALPAWRKVQWAYAHNGITEEGYKRLPDLRDNTESPV